MREVEKLQSIQRRTSEKYLILFQVTPNKIIKKITMSTEFAEVSETGILPWKRKSDYAKYVKKVYPVTEQLKELKSSLELKERESKALLERMNTNIKQNRQIISKLLDQKLPKTPGAETCPLPAGGTTGRDSV